LLREGLAGVKRMPFANAAKAPTTHAEDLVMPYVRDLRSVVDLNAVRAAGLLIAVDPLDGASRPYWEPINALYGPDITVVNPVIDPAFAFMTVDHDGKIRMDCSSPGSSASGAGTAWPSPAIRTPTGTASSRPPPGSRWWPRAAGSRPGRPAPRTSTRSTRRDFRDQAHLEAIVNEAQAIVGNALRAPA